MEDLKSELPYMQYKELTDYSSKPETEGIFYFKLAEIYNKGNYGGKYSELAKFLQFMGLNQTINPLNLVNEERALLWEIKRNAATTNKERELLYLSSFIDLMEGFLENEITEPEYKYFERELPAFKALWTKYTRMSELPGLEQYYSLFESFYKVNLERNNIFVKEMSGSLPKTKEMNVALSKDMIMTNVASLLADAKEVEVVITGGFHTVDVSRILQNARQSYVVITPNVTQDAAIADKLFAENVVRISKYIPTNTFQQPMLFASWHLSDKSLKAYIGIHFSKDILDSYKKHLQGPGQLQVSDAVLAQKILELIKYFEGDSDKAIRDDEGLKDFEITKIEISQDGSGYTVTANANGKTETFKVTDEGIEVISDDAQAYDVKEAKKYGWFGVGLGAVVSICGIIVSLSIAVPIIAVLGISVSTAAGLGISGFSAASIYNASQVKNALAKGNNDVRYLKNKYLSFGRVAEYVRSLNEIYKDELNGFRIKNVIDLDVIAKVDKENKVIMVNALALMMLNQDLIDNIILNHELTHIRGLMSIKAAENSEFAAHFRDTFTSKTLKSLFGKKRLAQASLNFATAFDEYNAYKGLKDKDGYKKAIRNLIESINILHSYGDMNKIFDVKQILEDLEADGATETLNRFYSETKPEFVEDYKNLLKFYGVEPKIADAIDVPGTTELQAGLEVDETAEVKPIPNIVRVSRYGSSTQATIAGETVLFGNWSDILSLKNENKLLTFYPSGKFADNGKEIYYTSYRDTFQFYVEGLSDNEVSKYRTEVESIIRIYKAMPWLDKKVMEIEGETKEWIRQGYPSRGYLEEDHLSFYVHGNSLEAQEELLKELRKRFDEKDVKIELIFRHTNEIGGLTLDNIRVSKPEVKPTESSSIIAAATKPLADVRDAVVQRTPKLQKTKAEDIDKKYVQKVKKFVKDYNKQNTNTGFKFAVRNNENVVLDFNGGGHLFLGNISEILGLDIELKTNNLINRNSYILKGAIEKEFRKMMGSLSELVNEYQEQKFNEEYIKKFKDFAKSYNNSQSNMIKFLQDYGDNYFELKMPRWGRVGLGDILEILDSDIEMEINKIINANKHDLKVNEEEEMRRLMGSLSELASEYKEQKSKTYAQRRAEEKYVPIINEVYEVLRSNGSVDKKFLTKYEKFLKMYGVGLKIDKKAENKEVQEMIKAAKEKFDELDASFSKREGNTAKDVQEHSKMLDTLHVLIISLENHINSLDHEAGSARNERLMMLMVVGIQMQNIEESKAADEAKPTESPRIIAAATKPLADVRDAVVQRTPKLQKTKAEDIRVVELKAEGKAKLKEEYIQ
ncbi:MAG: hypothetical protein FWG57_00055, partial [Endomicrobia bacterium]|nr:hypothetical protein [Endomicrobiia bacterium]